jgi:hypothetical protein
MGVARPPRGLLHRRHNITIANHLRETLRLVKGTVGVILTAVYDLAASVFLNGPLRIASADGKRFLRDV